MSWYESRSDLIIAHRGDRARAPENTLVAFEGALAAGGDAFEMDVHLTADGHLVVCHDSTVDRTTDGHGAISGFRLEALRELDAGASWSHHADPELANSGTLRGTTPFAGAGIRIPTLDEVLDAFPQTPLIIEAKAVRAGAALVDAIRRHNADSRTLVGSYFLEALRPARAAGIPTTAARRELIAMFPAALSGFHIRNSAAAALAIPTTHLGLPVPVRGFVRAVPRPVFVWTVNDPQQARHYFAAGVHGVITDDVLEMNKTGRLTTPP